jgi:transcriptional regulator with XRE-family HTH domain
MPRSPSSTVQAARNELGERLREIRKDVPLTAKEVADQAGWAKSKCSRLENGETLPSAADIRAWCRICGAEDQVDDLIAATRSVDSMYVQWRRVQRTGLTRLQKSYVPLNERTRTFRVYSCNVIPGFLQTEAYATALLSDITAFRAVPNDVPAAVAARMDRSQIIHRSGRVFVFLIEEAVLRYRVGDPETMAGQLGHLLAATTFPAVSIGIIPIAVPRRMWVTETFSIYDQAQAQVETLTAAVTITAPSEVQVYQKAFAEYGALAVHGAAARALVTNAIDSLG